MKTEEFTMFGETRQVPIKIWQNNKQIKSDTWDADLWIERGEDWYALMSAELKNKKVRIIERDVWLKCKVGPITISREEAESMVLDIWNGGILANEVGMPSFDMAKDAPFIKDVIDLLMAIKKPSRKTAEPYLTVERGV